MKFTITLFVILFGMLSCCSQSEAAVRTATSVSYALRPCSTCKEIVYTSEAACRQAAFDKATEVGLTRTTGSAVYTCITRFNVIATFYTGAPAREAILNWTYAPAEGFLPAEGFRIVYGTKPTELVNSIQLSDSASRTHTILNLAPGTYYFAIKSFAGGNDSDLSAVVSKTIL